MNNSLRILLKIAVFTLLISTSCQKNIDSEIKNENGNTEKSITLNEAIGMLKSKFERKGVQDHPIDTDLSYKVVAKETEKRSNISSITTNQVNNCKGSPRYLPIGTTQFATSLYRSKDGSENVLSTGRLIPQNFVRGHTYEVTFNIAISSSSAYVTPSIQVGLNNNLVPVPDNHCGQKIDLANYSNPYHNISGVTVSKNGTNAVIQFYKKTVTFVADQCYANIWFNFSAAGNYLSEYSQLIEVKSIAVKDVTGSNILIHGSSSFQESVTNTYHVSISGYPINEQFVWSTTGNLQIVGSNIGQTVQVISSNPNDYSGKLIATLPGCSNLVIERDFSRCVFVTNSDLAFPVQQGQLLEAPFPYGVTLPNNIDYTSIEWSVSGGNITSVNGSPFIEFMTVVGNQRVVVSATITNKCRTYHISGSRGIRQNPPPGGGGGGGNPPPTPIEW